MKICKLMVVRLIAVACASVIGPVANSQQAVGSSTMATASLSDVYSSPPIVPKPLKHSRGQMLRGNFADLKSNVVKEIGTTSAALQPESHKSQTADDWLIVLTALGLIVLQLRRRSTSHCRKRQRSRPMEN